MDCLIPRCLADALIAHITGARRQLRQFYERGLSFRSSLSICTNQLARECSESIPRVALRFFVEEENSERASFDLSFVKTEHGIRARFVGDE